MRIQDNSMSLKLLNNHFKANRILDTNIQRLSTGLRINKANDDAAGLAISERLTAKINENNQVKRNLQDKISFHESRDGVLDSIQSQIMRLKELSIQSKNGTMNENDLDTIQNEINTIIDNLNQTATNSTFNGKNLIQSTRVKLDGTDDFIKVPLTSLPEVMKDITVEFDLNTALADNDSIFEAHNPDGSFSTANRFNIHMPWGNGQVYWDFGSASTGSGRAITLWDPKWDGEEAHWAFTVNSNNNTMKIFRNGEELPLIAGGDTSSTFTKGSLELDIGKYLTYTDGTGPNFKNGGLTNFRIYDRALSINEISSNSIGDKTNNGLLMELDFNNGTLNTTSNGVVYGNPVWEKYSDIIGLKELNVADTDMISKVDNAIDLISKERSNSGIIMNKAEFEILNLTTQSTNQTASRMRIREADMSSESSSMVKQQIKIQTSTSMLTKLNQNKESILQLLSN